MGKRKESREALEQRMVTLENEHWAAVMALQAMVNGTVDGVETAREVGGASSYTYRLVRADAANGGVLIVTHHHPGQRDSSTAYLGADGVMAQWALDFYGTGQHGMAEALGRLADTQRRLIAERSGKVA